MMFHVKPSPRRGFLFMFHVEHFFNHHLLMFHVEHSLGEYQYVSRETNQFSPLAMFHVKHENIQKR